MIRKTTVEGGVVVGIPAADPRITAFKGIPFAAPPVGENRWRAPQPLIPWEGERECFKFAPIAMQKVPGRDPDNLYSREWNVDTSIEMSEDCLYLNVWTPAKSKDEKLPVFVWFFGGGLQEGNPAEMEFDGERIARRGIVVVTVNYRVNVFGFLFHPDLLRDQPDAPANFGHLDQRAGILWTKRNIAAFGGDPENITIGGQSAGGLSVCAQLTSPLNEGLFQKAIMMSGMTANVYGGPGFLPDYNGALKLAQNFFKFLGVETVEEARKIDAFTLRDKYAEFGGFWGTVIDGKFLKEDNDLSLINGRWLKVPLLVGCTTDETRPAVRAKTTEELREAAKASFGDRGERYMEIVGDDIDKALEMTRINAVEIATRSIKKAEEDRGESLPMYYYLFGPYIPGWDNAGAFHSSDLWFFFETLAKCWRPFKGYHYDLARLMCNYWANFMKTGDPNGSDADGEPMPLWKPFTTAGQDVMLFKDQVQPIVDTPNDLLAFLTEEYLKKMKE